MSVKVFFFIVWAYICLWIAKQSLRNFYFALFSLKLVWQSYNISLQWFVPICTMKLFHVISISNVKPNHKKQSAKWTRQNLTHLRYLEYSVFNTHSGQNNKEKKIIKIEDENDKWKESMMCIQNSNDFGDIYKVCTLLCPKITRTIC